MTEHFPICPTPPSELVQQWQTEAPYRDGYASRDHWLMERAAQWGADEELESTLAEVFFLGGQALANRVRAARRPKPPSLKKQALAELTAWTEMRNGPGESLLCDGLSVATIRRALEALPDD